MSHAHHGTVRSIWISGPLFLIGLVYVYQWIRATRLASGGVKGWRAYSFLVGLLLIWVALDSRLTLLDHQSLTAHMIQHLLLMTIAPPLIFLGAPWRLFPKSSVPRLMDVIAQWRGLAFLNPLQTALLHPVVGWIGACATLIVWHVPVVFIFASHSETCHKIEQASFLVAGLLFWRPVVEPSRASLKGLEWSLLLYLFLATLPCDILSGFLVFCDRVVYAVHSSSSLFGFSALEDQQCAGALMWTCVTVVYMIAGAILARHLLSPLSVRQSEVVTSNPKLATKSPKASWNAEIV
jgi:putative membrane protein